MTAKDQDGKVVFTKTREFEVYDLHLPDNKEGYLGLNDWDITAMSHVYDALEPFQTESLTKVVPLTEGTKSVTIEATFRYIYNKDMSADITSASKKIEF